MSNDNKKRRAREIAETLTKAPFDGPIQKELGELVLELIEEPEAPTIEETGWRYEYDGMIATDLEGDEVILVGLRPGDDDDSDYLTLWKNPLGRLVTLRQNGGHLRPTGRYAIADDLLKNAGEEQE